MLTSLQLGIKFSFFTNLSSFDLDCLHVKRFQHRRILKEPSRLFESMVVVGLHPNSDIQSGSGRVQNSINGQRQSTLAVTDLEPQVLLYTPAKCVKISNRWEHVNLFSLELIFLLSFQVLFVYPPDRQLPLKYRDLISFCFPSGVEVGRLVFCFYLKQLWYLISISFTLYCHITISISGSGKFVLF